jgi:hypothetical protein
VRRPGAIAAGVALAVALTLAGCSLVGSSATPKATNTARSALSALVPTYSAPFTAATAKSGTIRTTDAIQALIADTEIVHVDDTSKLVAATKSAGAFYGVERTISTTKGFDTIDQGSAMEKLLVEAGWTERLTTTTTTGYSAQLTVNTSYGTAALLLHTDQSPGVAPIVLIELASPDLPKK